MGLGVAKGVFAGAFFCDVSGGFSFLPETTTNYYKNVESQFSAVSDSISGLSGALDFGGYLTSNHQWSTAIGVALGPDLSFSGSGPGAYSDSNTIWDVYLEPKYHFKLNDVWEINAGPRVGYAFDEGSASFAGGGTAETWGISGSTFSYTVMANLRAYFGTRYDFDLAVAYRRANITNIEYSSESLAGVSTANPHSSGIDASGLTVKISIGTEFGARRARRKKLADQDPGSGEDASGGEARLGLPADSKVSENVGLAKQSQHMADSFIQAKRYVDADQAYRQAIKLDPANAGAWKGLGNAYYFRGHKKEALQCYDQALRLDPSDRELDVFAQRLRVAE